MTPGIARNKVALGHSPANTKGVCTLTKANTVHVDVNGICGWLVFIESESSCCDGKYFARWLGAHIIQRPFRISLSGLAEEPGEVKTEA